MTGLAVMPKSAISRWHVFGSEVGKRGGRWKQGGHEDKGSREKHEKFSPICSRPPPSFQNGLTRLEFPPSLNSSFFRKFLLSLQILTCPFSSRLSFGTNFLIFHNNF